MFGSYSHHLFLPQACRQRPGRGAHDTRSHPKALQLDATFIHSLARCALPCSVCVEACAQTLADPLNCAPNRARLTFSLAARAAGSSRLSTTACRGCGVDFQTTEDACSLPPHEATTPPPPPLSVATLTVTSTAAATAPAAPTVPTCTRGTAATSAAASASAAAAAAGVASLTTTSTTASAAAAASVASLAPNRTLCEGCPPARPPKEVGGRPPSHRRIPWVCPRPSWEASAFSLFSCPQSGDTVCRSMSSDRSGCRSTISAARPAWARVLPDREDECCALCGHQARRESTRSRPIVNVS